MNDLSQKTGFTFPPLGPNPALNHVIIGIGASTGGTEAVLEMLSYLPGDVPCIVVVQHMPPEGQFTAQYAQRLNRKCQMEVREAKHGDEIRRGRVYIAPANHHTRVVKNGNSYLLTCTQEPRISGHRPSVDALFHSIAENVTWKTVGIIMTGMGADGAEGLLAMHKKGAYTIGQDAQSSLVYGMPFEAYKRGAVDIQAPCDRIAGVLIQHLKRL